MRRILVLLLFLILIVSCSKKTGDASVINAALSQEPVTLDVMTNATLTGRIIASGNIYEKLLVLDGDGNIREELASSYSLSEDRKTLVFTLREGVFFHDGTEMKGEDACASMNRYLLLYPRAGEMTDGALFTVTGEYEISITSDKSLLFLPYLIASSPQEAIVMPHYLIDGTNLVTSVIGTGPYRFVSWTSGEKIVLERFDSYSPYGEESNGRWGRKEALTERVVYWFVPDSVTRLLGLESGQYDFINDVMSTDESRIEKNKDLDLIRADESGSIALVFNKKEGPLQSVDIRRAVSYALSSEDLMAACYGEGIYTTSSLYMEAWQKEWNTTEVNPYEEENRNKALEKLEGKGKIKIRILSSSLSNLDRIASVLRDELESVGIECTLTILDWASFIEKRQSSDWDIYISAFTSVPLPQMKSYLSPSFPGGIEEESGAYSVIMKMNDAGSVEDAEALWKEGQEILWAYCPVYIAGHYTTSYALTSSLSNIIVQNGFFFWNSVKKEKNCDNEKISL